MDYRLQLDHHTQSFCYLSFLVVKPTLYVHYIIFCKAIQEHSAILHLNHAVRRVYHPQLVAVYHQHEVLYIIKPQEDARWRVMRYSPKGADDMPSLRLG